MRNVADSLLTFYNRRSFVVATALWACVCLVAVVLLSPPPAIAHTVSRGVAEPRLDRWAPDQQGAVLSELAHKLRGSYVRFTVSWAQAEPQRGVYDLAYMGRIESAVALAHDNGLKVIITFWAVPRWASNTSFWGRRPSGPGYQAYYPISLDHLGDFRDFSEHMAALFVGRVQAYEAWNEPNLHLFLYPQRTATDRNFGPHLYVKMLRSFWAGINAGDPGPGGALVVAGGTSPRGDDNKYETNPIRFAKVLKAKGAAAYFDAYSHHPYMPGASRNAWPEAAPRDPSTTVTLQNLPTLLKLFPHKPFYLTEYGYQTAPCIAFSGQYVNQITQADYLRRAYAYVNRYSQVKVMLWYLLEDQSALVPYQGFYTGLETANGAPKRAWYVFARGLQLTLVTPNAIRRGAILTLTGNVTSHNVGVNGRPLVVQTRRPGSSWVVVKTVYSGVLGNYKASLRPRARAYYRVRWQGVKTSASRYVAVY
jgi:hypothetical protein